MTPTSALARRYFWRVLLAVAVYGVLMAVAAIWVGAVKAPFPALTWAVALSPAAPVLAAVSLTGRYLADEQDATQRAIQIEALVWAVGVTFVIATVWGFLQPLAGAPHVPSYLAFAVFCSVVASVQLARRLFPKR